jgi:hypothetical protein
MEKFVFRWNRIESGSLFGHRVAIIEDLPKPVKNACDPQRSNTLKARNYLKNSRLRSLFPRERDPTTKLLGLDNEYEDDDEYDSGVTLPNLVFVLVLVLLLVLDFGVFEIVSSVIFGSMMLCLLRCFLIMQWQPPRSKTLM